MRRLRRFRRRRRRLRRRRGRRIVCAAAAAIPLPLWHPARAIINAEAAYPAYQRTAIKTGKGATSWLSHFRGTHPQYSHAFQIAHSRDLLLTENKESVLFFTFDDSFAQEFRAPTICATACSGVSDVGQASSRP